MKTQIKNLVKSALFGVTVLGGAIAMQSFGEAFQDQTWYFDSDDPTQINVASNWTMTNPGKEGCDEIEADLPCDLNTPASVNSQPALQAHFQSEYQNNADDIKDAANNQREL